MKKKIGHATFECSDEFRGEVEITKGDVVVSLPINDLKAFVAESVRFDLAAHIQKMKPADLLRRIA